jgi:hypothetical protein
MRPFFCPLALAAALLGTPAMAQSSSGDATAAQALFDEAKGLMKSGRYEEACRKLEESQRLDPGGGTLVALALCYEAQGRLGSAWTEWNLALSDARGAHRADREAMAAEHVRALDKRMPRLRIVVPARAGPLEVRRDGVPVPDALWGTPVPTDPGEHRLEAHAPGKQAWTSTVVVRAEPAVVEVTVPALQDEAQPVAPPAAPPETTVGAPAVLPPSTSGSLATAPPPATPPGAAPQPSSPSGGSSATTWALVVGGVGVASLVAGSAFGLVASSKWNDAHAVCPRNVCTDPAAVAEGKDAAQAADGSTTFFVVGGVAAVVTVVLLVTSAGSSHDHEGSLYVTPMIGSTNGVALGGTL